MALSTDSDRGDPENRAKWLRRRRGIPILLLSLLLDLGGVDSRIPFLEQIRFKAAFWGGVLGTRHAPLKYPLDKHLFAQCHFVECCFSKFKQFLRVATRLEKTARNSRAVVTLGAIVLWMR